MPVLREGMQELKSASNYRFSAVNNDFLLNSVYTLGTLVMDLSGSVEPYKDALERMAGNIVKACKAHPMSENMLLRWTGFNDDLHEIFGFRHVPDIDEKEFKNALPHPIGGTNLFESVIEAIDCMGQYAKELDESDYTVNGVIWIVTDGRDNCFKSSPEAIKKKIKTIRKAKHLVSLTVLLIGLAATEVGVIESLQAFKDEADLNDFMDVGDATPKNLARVSQFVSESFSSHSKSLIDGVPPPVSSSNPIANITGNKSESLTF